MEPNSNEDPGRRQRERRLARVVTTFAFPAVIVALLVLVLIFRADLWAIFSQPDRIEDYVSAWGAAGPLVYIGAQTLQVVVFILPGDVVQVAGGYLFGVPAGVALSLIGIAIGSSLNFAVGRTLGIAFVNGLFGDKQVAAFNKLINSTQARLGFFLLFLIPGIPKDVLCYLGGLSSLRFPVFAGITMLARLPGIVGSAFIGDAAANRQFLLAGIIFGVAVALLLVGLVLRKRIVSWVQTLMRRRETARRDDSEDSPE